jgi:uncharacterized membrane protein
MNKTGKLVALVFEETDLDAVRSLPMEQEVGVGVAVQDPVPHQASAALEEIQKKAKEAGVELKDAVITFKRRSGRIKIVQTKDLTAGKGAGRGGFWGLLVGLIFGGPLLGALVGLGLGAIIGRRVDHGLDDEFIRKVGKSLKATNSALLLLIDKELTEEGIAYLESFNAELYITDISEEAEEAVSKAAEDEAIAQAVEAEFAAD